MLKIKERPDVGIFILRLVVGLIFTVHGYGKVFGGGPFGFGVSGFAGGLTAFGGAAIGIAWIVALIELLGGLALILGLFTKTFSILLGIEMVVALLMVHVPNGFYASNGEFPLLLLAGSLAILFLGAGRYALDQKFKKE